MKVGLFLLLLLSSQNVLAFESPQVFRDCGLSIELPQRWTVLELPQNQNRCKLKLQNSVSTGELEVFIAYKEYLVMANELGFDYFNGAWVTLGRQSSYSQAKEIINRNWEGLMGTVAAGCHDDNGYIGICPHIVAVLRAREVIDGRVLVIQGNVENPLVVEKIYSTLRPVF